MITRFHVEATGSTREEVIDRLVNAGSLLRDHAGGEWRYDDSNMEVISASKGGYWGRLTMRRIDGKAE
jgi:hypothetical protein